VEQVWAATGWELKTADTIGATAGELTVSRALKAAGKAVSHE
jgi:hypothetical protein